MISADLSMQTAISNLYMENVVYPVDEGFSLVKMPCGNPLGLLATLSSQLGVVSWDLYTHYHFALSSLY